MIRMTRAPAKQKNGGRSVSCKGGEGPKSILAFNTANRNCSNLRHSFQYVFVNSLRCCLATWLMFCCCCLKQKVGVNGVWVVGQQKEDLSSAAAVRVECSNPNLQP